MVSSNCARDGRSEIPDCGDCLFGGRMLKDNAESGEIRVQLYQMFQEVTLRVQYTGILWSMLAQGRRGKGYFEQIGLTVLGSEGTSPCKFSTIPSSSMALNTS